MGLMDKRLVGESACKGGILGKLIAVTLAPNIDNEAATPKVDVKEFMLKLKAELLPVREGW